MKKKIIRLTEEDLYRIIENSLDDLEKKKQMEADWKANDDYDYGDYLCYDKEMDDNYYNDMNSNVYDNNENMYNSIMGTKAFDDWDKAQDEIN